MKKKNVLDFSQALKNTSSCSILQFGKNITKGLGAGSNPEIGKKSAIEDYDYIKDILDGADMIFITSKIILSEFANI